MKCNHQNKTENEKIFSNGSKHIEQRCADCGKHIKYLPQGGEYIFYFGKMKGKNLVQALTEDFDYVYWCLENFEGSKVRKLQKAIDELSKKQ